MRTSCYGVMRNGRGSRRTTRERTLPHGEVWEGIFSYRVDGKQKPHRRPENTDDPHSELKADTAGDVDRGNFNVYHRTPPRPVDTVRGTADWTRKLQNPSEETRSWKGRKRGQAMRARIHFHFELSRASRRWRWRNMIGMINLTVGAVP